MLTNDTGVEWWANSKYVLFALPSPIVTNSKTVDKITNSDILIYPNPVSDGATISFSLNQEAEVSVSIYNNIGQEVSVMNLGTLNRGTHMQNLKLSNYSGGIYTVCLRINEQITFSNLITN